MDVSEQLKEIFHEVFVSDTLEIEDHTALTDIPQWDSLTHINLMLNIEGRFGIQFSSDQLSGFQTFGDLRQLIESKVVL